MTNVATKKRNGSTAYLYLQHDKSCFDNKSKVKVKKGLFCFSYFRKNYYLKSWKSHYDTNQGTAGSNPATFDNSRCHRLLLVALFIGQLTQINFLLVN